MKSKRLFNRILTFIMVFCIFITYIPISAYAEEAGNEQHNITINPAQDGTVTADKTGAGSGDIVTLSCTANDGFFLV